MEKGVIRWRGRLAVEGGVYISWVTFRKGDGFSRRHEDGEKDGGRFDVRNKFCRIGGMIEWRRIEYSNIVKWNARLHEHVFGENKQTVSTVRIWRVYVTELVRGKIVNRNGSRYGQSIVGIYF